jgi:RHS repeat-associated protein
MTTGRSLGRRLCRRGAVLVVASLVAGLAPGETLSAAGAAPAVPPQRQADDPRDGWRPASEGGEPEELAADRQLGTQAVPRVAPERRPEPKPEPRRVREVPERRTANSRSFELSDGRVQEELSAAPLHYRNGAGQWQPIDVTVGRSPRAGFTVGNETNAFRTYFGNNPRGLVRLEAAGAAVTLGVPDARPGNPVAEQNRVTYANGLGQGVDLAYEVTSESLKESVVLRSRPAGEGDLSVTFDLGVEGLEARQREDGSIVFEHPGGDGGPVLIMPAPFMMDVAEDLESPYGRAWSPAVSQTLSADGRSVTLTADGEWLRAAEREFPVVIDPTIRIAPTPAEAQDTMIMQEAPGDHFDSSWRLSVGTTSAGAVRSLLRFPLPDVPDGTVIDSAQLQLFYDQYFTDTEAVTLEARAATRPWTEADATWTSAASPNNGLGTLGTYTYLEDDGSLFGGPTGAWPYSTNPSFNQHAVNGDYRSNSGAATGDTYTWYTCPRESGNYRVEAHYVTAPDRATTAPYTVNYTGGSSQFSVNQASSTVAGRWSRLGTATQTFPLNAGCFTGSVVLGDVANKVVAADAVRWIKDATAVRPEGDEGSSWHSFSVQNLVQGWVDNPATNLGFEVMAANEGTLGVGGPRYEGSETGYGGETDNRPRLVVTYGRPGVELNAPTVIHATGADLSWSAYADPCTLPVPECVADNIVEYQVHRSVRQTFTPNASTLVAPVPAGTTAYTDTTAEPTPAADGDADAVGNAYYYMVAVKTQDGQVTPGSTRLARLPRAGRVTRLFPASYDTSLSSGEPASGHDTMFGEPWLYAGNNSGPPYQVTRTLVRFPALTGIPTTATVVDAKVRLWNREVVASTSPSTAIWELRALTRDFNEAQASWDRASTATDWATDGGDVSPTVLATATNLTNDPKRVAFESSSALNTAVQNWVRTPTSNLGLMVKVRNESTPAARAIFLSSEGEEPGLRPELAVTYLERTPEATYHAPSTPAAMEVGTTTEVPVTVTNTTTAAWADTWALSYRWTRPDGTAVSSAQTRTDLGPILNPGGTVTVDAPVEAPPPSPEGNERDAYVLAWDLFNTASGGGWLSQASGTNGVGALNQALAVEDSTSDQVGLESFYAYAGKNTGAGSTLMNNLHAGNAVWSYDMFANPSRGLSTFLRLAYNSKDTSDSVAGYGWSLQASSIMRLGVPLDPHPNSNGDEVSLTDGDGTTHVWTWDDAEGEYRHPAGVHLFLERKVECEPNMQQDPSDRAWVMTKPDRTEFWFNCAGYLTSIVDKNENEMRFVYEVRRSNNQPTHFLRYIEDATGRRTLTIDYYAKGAAYEFINDTTWVRQSGSNLTSPHIIDKVRQITDISGRTVEFVYTDKGLLGELVDGKGSPEPKRFAFRYDMTQGNKNVKLVRVTDPRGNATTIAYYSNPEDDPKFHWSTRTITDRLTGVTRFAYSDPDGTGEDPNPEDDQNVKTVVTDAENHASTYMTDGRGRPITTTNALNQTTTLGWDTDNNVERLQEANGAVSTWVYDPDTGYPTEIRDAEAHRLGYEGTTLRYQVGLSGYTADLIEKQSPEGRLWRFGYTLEGNLRTVTDPMGTFTPEDGDFTTTYTYDDWGQLLTATDANGNVTEYGPNYDPSGYPLRIADAQQRAHGTDSTFEYDVRGQVTATIDSDETRTTQTYDTYGRPLESRVPKLQAADEIIVTPAPDYDANDNVLQAIGPELWAGGARVGPPGAELTAIYDAADQVTETRAPKDDPADPSADPNRRTTFTYDRVGNLRTTTEPNGNLTPQAGDFTTTNTYDAVYQLTDVTNAAGHRVTYRYDNVGNVEYVLDPVDNETPNLLDYTVWFWNDHNHRPVVALDGVSYEVTFYDQDGLVVAHEDKGRNKTLVTRDARGLPAEVKVPHDGSGSNVTYRTTRYEYDEVGNRTHVVTPRGVATPAGGDFVHETVYDQLNRVKEELTPFDPADPDVSTPDRTIYDYDDDGHLTRVSAPPSDNQTVRNDTRYTHYDNGWVETATDPWGIVNSYDYNPLGQQTRNTLSPGGVDPADPQSPNRTMTWTYFGDGKLHMRSDAGIPEGRNLVLADNSDPQSARATGTWTRRSTDDGFHGFDYATHEAGTGTDTFEWFLDVPQDGDYEVFVRYPDVDGAAITASYKVTARDNAETTTTVNQTQNAGTWVRLGRYPFSQAALGKVTLTQNANGRVVADAVRLVRDNTGQNDDETIAYEYGYDPNGNMTTISDNSLGAAGADYEIAYSGLNQVARVDELRAGEPTVSSTFAYDPNGAIKTAEHPRSYAEFQYDARNLLSSVSNGTSEDDDSAMVTTYTYTPKGEREHEEKGNDNTVDYTYYLDGALRSQVERRSNETLVSEHTITYEPNGNRATDASRTMNADNHADLLETTTNYTYDPRDRVTQVVRTGDGAGTETFEYDANSNVINQNGRRFVYDRNRLMTSTIGPFVFGYTYDPFGRLQTVRVFGLEAELYTYDGFDRTLSYRANGRTTSYTYDPLDRTATKTTNAGTTSAETTDFNYLGLSSEVLDEEVAGQVSRSYQYSPWGERLSQVTHNGDGTTEDGYYGYNAHTDVETVTDETGNTAATYGYSAYGSNNAALFTGVDKPTASDPTAEPYNVYRFNSKRWDPASSGYDMGFRDYSPGLNRFTTRDMYNGALADLNLGTNPYTGNRYAFGGGNPVGMVEGDGHEPFPWHNPNYRGTPHRNWHTEDYTGHGRSSTSNWYSGRSARGAEGAAAQEASIAEGREYGYWLFGYDTLCAPDSTAEEGCYRTESLQDMGMDIIDPCTDPGVGMMACADALTVLDDGGSLTDAARAYAHTMAASEQFARDLVGSLAAAYSIGALTRATTGGRSPVIAPSSRFGNLTHSSYGIRPYSAQASVTRGQGGTVQAHHLIEQRFANVMGGATDDWASIVVTRTEHTTFTNAWRRLIPYGAGTQNATRAQVEAAARVIYKDYPEILSALGL